MLTANTKKVNLWYEPGNIVREINGFECEMTADDHGFLCGLIKEKRPSTILEIGVAEGGTTFIIDTAMKLIKQEGSLISVDISPQLYWDKRRDTGYVYKEVVDNRWLKHSFIIGHTIGHAINEVVEKLNGVIDFVVIDTTHIIPGELLDFIAVLPYLQIGTTVVLHDTMLNISRGLSKNPYYMTTGAMGASAIATKVLYNAVSGLKYIITNRIKKTTLANVTLVFLAHFIHLMYVSFINPIITINKSYIFTCSIIQTCISCR